jgi:hypothetical protein
MPIRYLPRFARRGIEPLARRGWLRVDGKTVALLDTPEIHSWMPDQWIPNDPV